MEINEKLQEAGLTGNESKVYLELVTKGELSANEVAKNLGIDRTLTYTVLNHLIEKGQVSYIIKKNKKMFSCANPGNLLNSIKSKEILVRGLIEELKKVSKKEKREVKVEVYEGKEGLRTIVRLIMRYKSFCSFGATGRAYDYLYEVPGLSKEWIKKKGSGRLITNPIYKKHEMTKIPNIKVRHLDIKSEVTTSIYGDYVSFHILMERPLVILIKDRYLAESYRNHFEVLWKVAKK
jgi:sugar-specific transcriptional regulator TrmB